MVPASVIGYSTTLYDLCYKKDLIKLNVTKT